MRRRPTEPRPSRTPARSGLTLLECVVATLVLSIVAVGLASASVATERLVSSMEEWCRSSPTLYLVPRAERYERLLGCAADLSADGARSGPSAPGTVNTVAVLATSRDLVARSASVRVRVEAIHP